MTFPDGLRGWPRKVARKKKLEKDLNRLGDLDYVHNSDYLDVP